MDGSAAIIKELTNTAKVFVSCLRYHNVNTMVLNTKMSVCVICVFGMRLWLQFLLNSHQLYPVR